MKTRALSLLLAGATALVLAVPASADTSTPVTNGLRGTHAQSLACDVIMLGPDDVRIVGALQSFRVCSTTQLGKRILLTKTKRSAAFRAMRSALAARDGIAKANEICRHYADVQRTVYVVTSKGIWNAHLPVDGCGHYTQAVRAALAMSAGTA